MNVHEKRTEKEHYFFSFKSRSAVVPVNRKLLKKNSMISYVLGPSGL